MAIITDITPNKSGDKVKIYLEGELYGVISADTVYKYGLRIGLEIDSVELDEIVSDSDKELAAQYLFNYLTRFQATEKKARAILRKKGYSDKSVEHAIKKALEYRYLDDYAYAERFIERKIRGSGRDKIKSELIMLGVPRQIINELIGVIDEEEVFDNALTLARKWWSQREVADYANKEKFARYMNSRGYRWNIISRCYDAIKTEALDEEYTHELE